MMTESMRQLLERVRSGERIEKKDAESLFSTRGREIWEIAQVADELREKRVGSAITWVRNQNLNVTNICVNSCGFCGFSKKVGEAGVYTYTEEEIKNKAKRAKEREVTEICTVSGLHPTFTLKTYTDIYHWITQAAPGVHLHASNPMEVAYAAEKDQMKTKDVLLSFKEAGVGSLCGTAAEILVDSIRAKICPEKISTSEWVRIIKEAHNLGLRTTATIMYGHCESISERVEHLSLLREIQDETGGFTEFVPLPYIHDQTPLYKAGRAQAGPTGREDLLMIAVSRIFLDNIKNIQVSWVKEGNRLAQLNLNAGANDLGGTLYEESISKGAGAKTREYLDPEEMRRLASDLGRPLVQRTTLYERV